MPIQDIPPEIIKSGQARPLSSRKKIKKEPKIIEPEPIAGAKEAVVVKLTGVDVVTLKGEQGEQGEPGEKGDLPSKEELISIIKPLMPPAVNGRNGVDGKDADEAKIVKEVMSKIAIPKNGKDGSPDTGEVIVNKINNLELESAKQIDFQHIKNFPWHMTKGDGGGGGNFTGYGAYDLNIKSITLGQITANQNDYETGLGGWFRISSDAARTITGFLGGTDGRGFVLSNVGSFNITLANESASSAAAYRIITGTGADMVLLPNDDVWLLYDITSERWRVIERGTGSIASGTINEIAYFDTATTVSSLPVDTYPSLTELSYVKGVTSAIQTQLDAKADDSTTITIAGTANQITSSAGAQDLSANRTWTLSLPSTISGVNTIIGGSSTTQDLTFQTTTGIGASGADMHFLVGNNGATEAMTILNSGNIGIGVSPVNIFHIKAAAGSLHVRFEDGTQGSIGFIGGANGIITGAGTNDFAIRAESDLWLSGSGNATDVVIKSGGKVGFSTTAPDKVVEINSATGINLRLTYNDSNGSAANYADFETTSSGDLNITPSGGDATITGSLTVTARTIFNGTTTSSGAGAVGITGSIHEITTTGTGDALTLADGAEGQRLSVIYVAEGAGTDTAVLTPTNFGSGSTITFSVIGQSARLIFTNGKWYADGDPYGAIIA